MKSENYHVRWFSIFEFPDPATENTWYKGPRGIAAAIDLLAETCLWPELQMFGRDFKEGEPLVQDLGAIKQCVASGPDVYVFVRGSARSALFTNEAEIAIEIDLSPFQVEFKVEATKPALDRLGARFLDDMTAVFVRLLDLWQGKTHLVRCAAVPLELAALATDLTQPYRAAVHNRWLKALVDIVMTGPPPEGAEPMSVAESRAIAAAMPPESVLRTEYPNAAVLRWVDDPRDIDAVIRAARQHEAWMCEIVETELRPPLRPPRKTTT